MTSQPLRFLLVLMLMFTLSSIKASEHNGNEQLQHRRGASEKSQEYVERTTTAKATAHNRRHHQHQNQYQHQHHQHRHHPNESTTNYHQQRDINDINNKTHNIATTATKDFGIKSNRNQLGQDQRLPNTRDRHTEPLQVDVSNKRHHRQHMTATAIPTASATTTTTTSAPEREDVLHLTLNAANEDNDRIGYNDIAYKRKISKHNHDDVVVADDENYYDDFDYTPQDYVANDDAADDDARRHLNAKKLKSHNINLNYNRAKAFAARRVPRDQRYVGPRWNAISIDNSNEEDYPADEAAMPMRPGDYTIRKHAELGTPQGAQETFKSYLRQLHEDVRRHQDRVAKEASCSVPKPQVEYINHHTSEQFSPRGTILHRCNKSTGCCLLPSKVCGPKTTENVVLPFEVQRGPGTQKQIVMIQLVNHTECKCDNPSMFGSDPQRRKRSHVPTFNINTPRPVEVRHRATCQCPKHFERIIKNTEHDYESDDYDYGNDAPSLTTSTTECSCDCHSDNLVCQRLKNGEEGFAVFDRKCISRNDCTVPTCNHGSYNPQVGRCPHVQSTTSTTNITCNHSHNHHGCHRNYG